MIYDVLKPFKWNSGTWCAIISSIPALNEQFRVKTNPALTDFDLLLYGIKEVQIKFALCKNVYALSIRSKLSNNLIVTLQHVTCIK